MSSSSKTPNVALPQFGDTDRPTWRGDMNSAFFDIDAAFAARYTKTQADALLAGKAAKSSLFVNVLDFGAKGDGIADDTAAIQAAITASNVAGTKLTVLFPGGTYKITAPLVLHNAVRLVGAGRSKSRINVATGSFVNQTSGAVYYLFMDGLKVVGQDSHVFNFSGTGGLVQSHFTNCELSSGSVNAAVFRLRGTGSFQENTIDNTIMDRLATTTFPIVDIVDQIGAANCNLFSRITIHSLNNVLAPAIRMEAATVGTYVYDNLFDSVVGEQNPGGLLHLYSARGTVARNVLDYDASVNYVDDVFKLAKSATSSTLSTNNQLVTCGRRGGTLNAGVYDVNAGPSTMARGTYMVFCGNHTSTPVINCADYNTTGSAITVGNLTSLIVNSSATTNLQVLPAYASSNGIICQEGAAGYAGILFGVQRQLDTKPALTLNSAGDLSWCDGTNATDLKLSRKAAGVLGISSATTQTTAPSAGAAGALPTAPAGYLNVNINGVSRFIPYY